MIQPMRMRFRPPPVRFPAMRAFWRGFMATALVCLSAATVAALPDSHAEDLPTPVAPIASVASADPVLPKGLLAKARYRTVSREVQSGETAGSALMAMGAPVDAILRGAGSELNRIYTGNTFALDYEIGATQPFRVRLLSDAPVIKALEKNGDSYVFREYPIPYTVETAVVSLKLTGSLWEAGKTAGLSDNQIMSLAKIFETEVDFNTELDPGAEIRLVTERLTDEEGNVRFGEIRAARLMNAGKSWTFLHFRDTNGRYAWLEPDGEGRRRPFLRSPLEYSKVTSGFSLGRFHPILKETRPHYGVDFGAPTGTPVRAVADGTVVMARRNGGHGNYVEVKHEGSYATSYSHLSAILVKPGQKIHQGDVVGRVGATGLATGPHLHFQLTMNGKYVDPLHTALPMTGSLATQDMTGFRALKEELLPLLDAP